jgi:shikimate kinase
MKIFLVGVSCVGKTTIGKRLAERLGYAFFDLDTEIEHYFALPLSV